MSAHSDDGDSILGESGYEILTDSILLTDEEDDGTSSVASLDGHSEDDNVSLAETESLPGHPSESSHDIHLGIPSFDGLDDQDHERHLDDSDMTLRNTDLPVSELVFEEPEEYDAGDIVSVSRTITHFQPAEAAEICHHLRVDDPVPTHLFSTVRQTMTKQLLDMDGSFRILYIGSLSAKEEIFQKIGQALAVPAVASTSSSSSWEGVKSPRYNIVPISSFGARSSSPEVELVESLGMEMAVDVCTAAKATKLDGKPDTLSLWLNGNQNVSSYYGDNGIQIDSPGWKSPHLAVVYISDDDNVQKKMTRVCARSFMTRHKIPTLVISQNPQYKPTEIFTLDPKSIHMCIESDGPTRGHLVHRRIPVDLSTFLSLEVNQLNRSLACMTELGCQATQIPPAPVGRSARSSKNLLARDVEKTPLVQGGNLSNSLYWIREKKRDGLWKVFLVGWLFIFGVIGATISIAYMKYTKPLVESPVEQVVQSVTAIATVTTTSTSIASAGSPFRGYSSVSRVPAPSVPSCGGDLSTFLQDPTKVFTSNTSDRFQVHVIGNNHIILRPPHRYVALRKPPTLYVHVSRNDETVKAELSKLFDGLYTLNLDDDESWGVMNVTITTKSKPIINEVLEVDFGTPWLRAGPGWKRASQKGKELQTFLGQTTADARTFASGFGQTAGKQAQEMREVVVARAKELTREVSKLYQETKDLTRSVQFFPFVYGNDYVRKAQSQAKTVWERRTASTPR